MKIGFLAMGNYEMERDQATIRGGETRLVGVADLDQACQVAREMQEEGVGCIELCGAFGPEGARRLIEATEGKLPIGYVVHFPEQDDLFAAAFPGDKKK